MFDITSSKLFLLAIVALLVIGPKDFPVLLRTIGRYIGIIRGHAKEFRAQFDEAMRETELAQLKQDMENIQKDVHNIAQETETSLNATGRSVEQTFDEARQTMEGSLPPTPEVATGPATQTTPEGVATRPPEAAPEVAAPAAPPSSEPAPEGAPIPTQTVTEPAVPGHVAPAPAAPAPAAPAAERTGA